MRELDCSLNVSKVFTHTPKMTEISSALHNSSSRKQLLPAMYNRIMEVAVEKARRDIEGLVSHYMESYSTAADREAHLKRIFIDLYLDERHLD